MAGMMLEHAMQAQHHEIVATTRNLVQPLGLRDGMGDATRTQHLEGMENHYLAAQRFQRQRHVGVEPNASTSSGGALEIASVSMIGHDGYCDAVRTSIF